MLLLHSLVLVAVNVLELAVLLRLLVIARGLQANYVFDLIQVVSGQALDVVCVHRRRVLDTARHVEWIGLIGYLVARRLRLLVRISWESQLE